jgi:molecular chaperone DnaJ
MSKDYYEVLGVGEDATGQEIRSAYRRRAKECHPDCADVGSEPFRAVQEAYEVLSDPTRRRAYDREHEESTLSTSPGPISWSEPVRPRRSPVEPLVPSQPMYQQRRSFPDEFSSSPLDSILGGLWGGFGTWGGVPTVPRELEVELRLSPAQASQGGTFHVQVPARVVCPSCYGEGWVGPYRCQQCGGAGAALVRRPVTVSYPAGIASGDVGRMSLGSVGLPDSDLVVRFRVQPR